MISKWKIGDILERFGRHNDTPEWKAYCIITSIDEDKFDFKKYDSLWSNKPEKMYPFQNYINYKLIGNISDVPELTKFLYSKDEASVLYAIEILKNSKD